MKYTLRAVLALGLLAGCYLLALLVVGCLAFGGYAFLRLGVSGAALAVPFLLAGLGTYAVFTVMVASARARREVPDGMLLTPDAQPELWTRVRALADEVGTRPPDEIRLVSGVDASVAETTRLLGLAAGTRRMTIGVPLLLGLTRGQLTAVLAHELGHYSGRQSVLAPATYRGGEALRRVQRELGADSPVGRGFARYAGWYARVSSVVNRRQELAADEAAARIAGRDVTIAALLRLAPLGAAWQVFRFGYLEAAHELGLRPNDVADGFLDLLEDPQRRVWLASVRDQRHTTIFDGHPTTSRRVALLGMSSDGGEEDVRVPGFAVLTNPDPTMATFFASVYAEEGNLEPADWAQIGAAVSRSSAEADAEHLVRAVRTAPWRGGRAVTFEAVATELRNGRGPELAGRVAPTVGTAQRRELAGLLVGSLLGVTLVQRGLASYPLDWSGSGRLVDRAGRAVDVLGLGDRAVGSHAGVAELMAFVEGHGIAANEVLLPVATQDGPEPARVLGCVAPLRLGLRWVIAMPCTLGLAVVRPRGASEWIQIGSISVEEGTARQLASLVLRAPIEEVVQRPGSRLFPWDEIASARLEDRPLGRRLLTLTTSSGETCRLKVPRKTDTYGDPWDPWDVIQHFLDERLEVLTSAREGRTGSRAGVLEP